MTSPSFACPSPPRCVSDISSLILSRSERIPPASGPSSGITTVRYLKLSPSLWLSLDCLAFSVFRIDWLCGLLFETEFGALILLPKFSLNGSNVPLPEGEQTSLYSESFFSSESEKFDALIRPSTPALPGDGLSDLGGVSLYLGMFEKETILGWLLADSGSSLSTLPNLIGALVFSALASVSRDALIPIPRKTCTRSGYQEKGWT